MLLSLWSILLLVGSHQRDSVPVQAGDAIRIGLVRSFRSAPALTAIVPAGGSLECRMGSKVVSQRPGIWRLAAEDDGKITVRGSDGEIECRCGSVILRGGDSADSSPVGISLSDLRSDTSRSKLSARGRSGRGRSGVTHYRGSIEIEQLTSSGLRVVNVVHLEEYLRGVVRLEMGEDAPAEALKAQAVAARTYAVKSRGRFAKEGYDLTDTTICQAYGGVEAECEPTDRSVRDTRGLALYRENRLILADYYDDCGGVTACANGEDDFPPSVVDKPEGGDDEYCARGRSHTWQIVLPLDEMARIARSIPGWPASDKPTEVQVGPADESGRVRTVRFSTTHGASKDMKAAAFRAAVGYERLKSTLFTVEKSDGGFVFEGRGYGHGRGMCQSGAIGMASPPYRLSFREILAHYFPGAEVKQLDAVAKR